MELFLGAFSSSFFGSINLAPYLPIYILKLRQYFEYEIPISHLLLALPIHSSSIFCSPIIVWDENASDNQMRLYTPTRSSKI